MLQILLARASTDYPAASPPPLRFIRSCSSALAAATLHKLEATFKAPVLEVRRASFAPSMKPRVRKLSRFVDACTIVTVPAFCRTFGPRDSVCRPVLSSWYASSIFEDALKESGCDLCLLCFQAKFFESTDVNQARDFF